MSEIKPFESLDDVLIDDSVDSVFAEPIKKKKKHKPRKKKKLDMTYVGGIVPFVSKPTGYVGTLTSPLSLKRMVREMEEAGVLFGFDSAKLSALQKAYIVAYASTANKTRACLVAGVTMELLKEWSKEKVFNEYMNLAVESMIDMLEEEAFRRAMGGSDKLLIKLLKAYKPEMYTEKVAQKVEMSGSMAVESWADLARKATTVEAKYEEVGRSEE